MTTARSERRFAWVARLRRRPAAGPERDRPTPPPGPPAPAPVARTTHRWRLHACVLLALLTYHAHLLRRHRDLRRFEARLAAPMSAPATAVAKVVTTNLAATAASKGYDCAFFWLRLPKTASTSIQHSFLGPMINKGLFSNTEHDPNTCIEGVGGCAPFWKGWRKKSARKSDKRPRTPPYGVPPAADGHSARATRRHQRCFPHKSIGEMYCNEFDPRTSTLNFGPHRHEYPQSKRKRVGTSTHVGYYASGPELKTHVGLDPSLFGWVLPPRPLVFSTFREPLARFLSGFGYGITLGAGRPGEVEYCELPSEDSFDTWKETREDWERRVVEARKVATARNDTRPYQRLLRDYLDACGTAVDNVYVAFLDPRTKDVAVALANLERHVIVGLQEDLDQTLDEWRNITLETCTGHPRFPEMQRLMAKESASHDHGHTYREAVTLVGGEENDDDRFKSAKSVPLVSPSIDSFDKDLQLRVRGMIAGDEVIYKRVLEMYYKDLS